MKRNFLVATVVTGLLGTMMSDSRAQVTNTPSATPAAAGQPAQPAPGAPPPQRPPFQRRPQGPAIVFQRAVLSLRQAKMQLQRAEGDLGGHKQTAMDACDKAMEELSAAMKALPTPPPPQAAPQATPPGQSPAPAQAAPVAKPAPTAQ